MVAPRIPRELLMGMPLPAQGGGGFVDAPSEDPALRAMEPPRPGLPPSDPFAAMMPGASQALGGTPTNTDPFGGQNSLMSPLASGFPVPNQDPMGGQDPVLAQLMAQMGQNPQPVVDQEKIRRGKVPRPKAADIDAVAQRDMGRYASTITRMARDVALFRQHEKAVPKSFSESRETAVASSQFSTLVNKLSNMFSGVDQIYTVPYDTTPEEKSAQIIEDALYQLRKLSRRQYGRFGGNLQRDEFFHMFLHGRYVKRILPDLEDSQYPYAEALLDPATVFPTFGGPKKGLIRVIHRYQSTVGEVISTFGNAIPDLEKKLATKLGYERYNSASDYLDEQGEVIEYWDSWWRRVTFKGEEVMPVTEHGIGQVPFVYIMPVGEPLNMRTPGGHYLHYDRSADAHVPVLMSQDLDMAEKGVSVYHYLINTHRIKEMLLTILYNEVEKAGDPATITYTAPHLGGQEQPPLDTKRGGTNYRQLNFQQVESVPTSPRPTDFSPIFQSMQQELIEGSFPPGMFGADQAANQTGSGADAMMQNAKDLVLPYIQGWEIGQAQEAELKLNMYVDTISPIITISAPAHDSRGRGAGDVHDLSPYDIQQVGTFVEVKMIGMTLGNEAQMIAAMNQAVQAGFFSQRHAMNRLNVQNPDKMFAEIIAEKAMQHPEIMENFLIPEGFMADGQSELAQMWMELVVAPKMMMMGQQMAQASQPQGPQGVGSQAVPDPNNTPQAPGGPPPGQGRGPESGGMTGI